MSNARTEKDPDAKGMNIEIKADILSVGEVQAVKEWQKFTMLLDVTEEGRRETVLEVEWFGKEIPAWYEHMAPGKKVRCYCRASSREGNNERWYTTVNITWAGSMRNQSATASPPPFDNSPIPPPPRQEYQDEIPF